MQAEVGSRSCLEHADNSETVLHLRVHEHDLMCNGGVRKKHETTCASHPAAMVPLHDAAEAQVFLLGHVGTSIKGHLVNEPLLVTCFRLQLCQAGMAGAKTRLNASTALMRTYAKCEPKKTPFLATVNQCTRVLHPRRM